MRQVPYAGFPASGKIKFLANGRFHDTDPQKAVDRISYVGEVSGFLTTARDRQGQALHRVIDEIRNDIAVLSGYFSSPIIVEEACFDNLQTVMVVEEIAVQLP